MGVWLQRVGTLVMRNDKPMADKIISLDVWNTLLKYNPECGCARTDALHKLLGINSAKIVSVYRSLKHKADRLALVGVCLSQQDTYEEFIVELGYDGAIGWMDVRECVEQTFKKHPPFIHPELITVLAKLAGRGYKFGIASNNNFISGDVIDEVVLRHLGVPFEFAVHSTDVQSAKPSAKYMNRYMNHVENFYVVHIGDNIICDDFTTYVAETIYVSNPAETITVLKEMLER